MTAAPEIIMAMYFECPSCVFADAFVLVGPFNAATFKAPTPVCEYGCGVQLVLVQCGTFNRPRSRFLDVCGFVRDTHWSDETPREGRS